MWVVFWHDERLIMFEEHFEDIYKAHKFIESLEAKGIYNAKLFKEPFNR